MRLIAHRASLRPFVWTLPLFAAATMWAAKTKAVQSGQPSAVSGEWPAYAADLAHTHYSPLDQINASNFNTLEIAWPFKTDSL